MGRRVRGTADILGKDKQTANAVIDLLPARFFVDLLAVL
jgi:hypothetical protein